MTPALTHWNLWEIAWTTISIVGMVLGSYNFRESLLDLLALGHIKNGRRLIAWSSLIRDGLRVVVCFLATVAGFMAATRPGEPQNPVAAAAFLGALIVAVLFSGFDARIRHVLLGHPSEDEDDE